MEIIASLPLFFGGFLWSSLLGKLAPARQWFFFCVAKFPKKRPKQSSRNHPKTCLKMVLPYLEFKNTDIVSVII
jgi:hypothetical protein